RRPGPARRAGRGRPHAGPAAAEGRLPGVVRRPAVAVHRHHDERRPDPLGGQRDRRRRPAAGGAGALPHDRPPPGPARRRRRAPAGLVPPWDFDAPADGPVLWDSSAGAIAASGLWDLSEQVGPGPDRDRYRAAALTVLETLCSDAFLARGRPGWEGILRHGV